jgi:hypothetical protein
VADPDETLWRRRRRRRVALEAILLTMIVCLLVLGLDRLARTGAESLLQRDIQEATGVEGTPTVDLAGGPVLGQAIAGAYRQASVDVRGVRSGPLEVAHVRAQLHDVRLPLQDLLLRDIRRVGIGRSVDVVTLQFDDLNAYFETTGRSLRLYSGTGGGVQMVGFFDVLGQTVRVSGPVEVWVDGTQLRISPQTVDTGSTRLSPAGRVLLDQRLDLTVPLDGLPFGNQFSDVTIAEDGLRLIAQSRAIILRP